MKPRFPRLQISLRALLVIFTLFTAVGGYFLNRVVMERVAQAKLEKSGLLLACSREYAPTPGFHGTLFFTPGLEQSESTKTLRGKLRWELFRHVRYVFGHANIRLTAAPVEITDEQLQPFEYLHDVESIDIGFQPVGDKGMKHLRHLQSLKTLGICATKVGDDGLKELTGLTNLEYMGIEFTNVSDAGLEHLAGLSRLKHISLMDTNVNGPGLKHLAGLRDLEILGLPSNPIHSADLKHLTKLTKLQMLFLSDTKIDDEAGDSIAQLTSLETLWVDGTEIGDDFIAKIANLKNLTDLNIDGTRVSGASEKILSSFPRLQNFYAYDSKIDYPTQGRIKSAPREGREGDLFGP
jgi:hypothetical protein